MKNVKWKLKLQSFKPCIQNVQTWQLIYNKRGKRGSRLSINRFVQLNRSQHSVQNINVIKTYIRIKCTLSRLQWYIPITIQRSVWEARHTRRLATKQSAWTFAWGALSSRSIPDKVISSSLWIQLGFCSTQYLISKFQPKINTKHEVS